MRSLDYAITRADRLAASQALSQAHLGEPIAKDFYRRGLEAAQEKDPDKQRAMFESLRADSLKVLNDSRFSDQLAMQLGAGAYQAGGMAKAALQENYTNRLQGLNAIVTTSDPGVSIEAKARAAQSIVEINSDPKIVEHMTAGQRAYAQGTLNQVYTQRAEGDHLAVVAEANAGRVSPAAYKAEISRKLEAGTYGSHPGAVPGTSPAQLGILMKTQEDNYNKNLQTIAATADGMAAAARGETPNPTQIAAMKDKNQFNLPGEAQVADISDWYTPQPQKPATPNIANPDHRSRIADYVRINGFMPDSAREATQNMTKRPNEDAMAPWVDMYNQLYAVAADRAFTRTGKRPSDRELVAEVGEMMGPSVGAYLSKVALYGAEKAYAQDLQSKGPSVTGQLGQPNDASLKAMDAAASNFTRDLGDPEMNSSYLSKIMAGRGIFSPWRDTERERAVKGITGVSPDVAPGALATTLAIRPQLGPVTMRPEVKEFLAGHANADLAVHGQTYSAVLKDGQTIQDYAFMAQAERFKGILEAVSTPNGTEIGFKSWGKAMAEKMGRDKLSNSDAQATASALVQAERRLGGTGPEYDPASVGVTPYLDSGNQAYWLITGRDKYTGAPVRLMDIPQNDPRLREEVMARQTVARDILQRSMQGDDGKPANPDRLDRIAAGFTRMVVAPMESWLMEHYGGRAIDSEAFRTEFDSRLRHLDEVAGKSNAPDWRKTLEKIARDPTPADGRAGAIQDLARRYTGITAPEVPRSQRPQ